MIAERGVRTISVFHGSAYKSLQSIPFYRICKIPTGQGHRMLAWHCCRYSCHLPRGDNDREFVWSLMLIRRRKKNFIW